MLPLPQFWGHRSRAYPGLRPSTTCQGQRWLLHELLRHLRSKLGDDANNPAYVSTVLRTGPWRVQYRNRGDDRKGSFAG